MATWETVRDHMNANYRIKENQGDYLTLVFDLDNDRSQIVIVSKAGNDKIGEWAQVESPVGKIGEVNLELALRETSGLTCGGLSCAGDLLTVRDAFPLRDLSIDELEQPLHLVTTTADLIERKLSPTDTF